MACLLEVASIDHAHESTSRAMARSRDLASTLLMSTAAGAASARALRRGDKRVAIEGIHGHDVMVRRGLVGQGGLLEEAEHSAKIFYQALGLVR